MTRQSAIVAAMAVIGGTMLALAPGVAGAYVGPGAGLASMASLVVLVGVVILALVGLVVFPLRLLLKRRRAAKSPED